MKMIDISRFVATTLDESTIFQDFTEDLINEKLDYFINVDIYEMEVPVPYFAIATFEDTDDKSIEKSFKTQILLGIGRTKPVKTGNITEETSIEKTELIAKKAIEIVSKEMRTYGISGETNIEITYINFFIPKPEGEEDLQVQIDIKFEQQKYLKC